MSQSQYAGGQYMSQSQYAGGQWHGLQVPEASGMVYRCRRPVSALDMPEASISLRHAGGHGYRYTGAGGHGYRYAGAGGQYQSVSV